METTNNYKIALRVLWIILTLQIATTTSKIFPEPRIAGGNAININEAKFVVQVITEQRCGGSLVTPLHVVTAAHCVDDVEPSAVTVIAGATYFNRDGLRRTVDNIYLPKEYENLDSFADIAVLRLSAPLTGPSVETIELCNTQWDEGALFKVYGWGNTLEEPYKPYNIKNRIIELLYFLLPTQLHVVEVPALSLKKCEQIYGTLPSNAQFCAGVPGEKDSCRGDSGGPAVYNNQLCGVVSGGPPCPNIGLYVNINHFREFLDIIIKLDGE